MSRWYRWLPAAAVPAVVGAVALTSQAGAADLPEKSPEDVLAMIGNSSVEEFSGSFAQSSDLGLPGLPGGAAGPGGASSDDVAQAVELITGDHTGRVWVSGEDAVRLQVMDSFSERDLVRNGQNAWVYDSRDNSALHLSLPDHPAGTDAAPGQVPTPEEMAKKFVDAAGPSTELTVAEDVTVAGREAYELVLTPRTDETLVGSVAIAVDGETGFPLRVTVEARGQEDPAFELGYTSFTLGAPDAARFEFTPPAGAKVEEKTLPDSPAEGFGWMPGATGQDQPTGPMPTVDGEGWNAVVVLPAGQTDLTSDPMLAQMTQAVDGGRLLSTALVNALITDDGRVLVGSVPLERLQAVAGS
jgi:outer membrane lipoprotein-sorting protein